MPIFVVFIVWAVMIGAGTMLAPAWRTREPRIGLATTLALTLVAGGAVFWAFAFGWDTLVVDYLLFALVSLVVLGGTLSQAQARAEARGETLADELQGWPGPRDLLAFAAVGALITLGVLLLPAPDSARAQVLAEQTRVVLAEGRLDAAADNSTPYPPAFIALTAYLSQQLNQDPLSTQYGVAAVLVFVLVWLAYDLGGEFRDKRLGRGLAVAALPTFLLWLSGQYTTLFALMLMLALATYLLRVVRHADWWDAVAAGLMLGAVLFSDWQALYIAVCLYAFALAWAFSHARHTLPHLLAALGVMTAATAPYTLALLWGSARSPLFGVDVYALLLLAVISGGGWLLARVSAPR